MRKRTVAIAASALAMALGLGACATTPTDGTSTAPASSNSANGGASAASSNINPHPYSDLKDGGELNLSINEFTEQKNQFQADGSTDTWTLWDLYNAELIKFTPDGDLNINKNYLSDVKDSTVDGNTVVTYAINPKAAFNDGTPIDIKTFQNTWKSTNGSDENFNANSTDGWNKIKSIEAGKDDREVVVTFNGAWPWWGGLFNTLLHPACDTAECFNQGYIGSDLASAHPEWGAGPYKLDSFDANAGTAVFVPNDKWWGDKGKLEKITLTQREVTAATNAFVNGEADATQVLSMAQIFDQVKNVPGTETRKGLQSSNAVFEINTQSGMVQDKAVRQAIMMGINRAQLGEVMWQGMDWTEPAPGSLLLFPNQDGYEDNFSKVVAKSDVDGAKKVLEDAGYTMGSDGYYAKGADKLTVSFTNFSDSQGAKTRTQVIQSQLKAVGIDMQIDQRASTDFADTIAKGDWEMVLMGLSQSDPYGVAYTCQIWCSEADANYSGLNKTHSGSKELDAKIHDMEALATAEEQIKAANAVEVEEFKDYSIMPLYNGPAIVQAKTGLANIGSGVFAGKASPIADFAENVGWVK